MRSVRLLVNVSTSAGQSFRSGVRTIPDPIADAFVAAGWAEETEQAKALKAPPTDKAIRAPTESKGSPTTRAAKPRRS